MFILLEGNHPYTSIANGCSEQIPKNCVTKAIILVVRYDQIHGKSLVSPIWEENHPYGSDAVIWFAIEELEHEHALQRETLANQPFLWSPNLSADFAQFAHSGLTQIVGVYPPWN